MTIVAVYLERNVHNHYNGYKSVPKYLRANPRIRLSAIDVSLSFLRSLIEHRQLQSWNIELSILRWLGAKPDDHLSQIGKLILADYPNLLQVRNDPRMAYNMVKCSIDAGSTSTNSSLSLSA